MNPRHALVFSDPHLGCKMGLCPPQGVELDGGGWYHPSLFQNKVYDRFLAFLEWSYDRMAGEDHIFVLVGDAFEGLHHRATTPISHNMADQERLGLEVLRPIFEKAVRRFVIAGTETHVGKSATEEARLARILGADESPGTGSHVWWELLLDFHGHLIDFKHHQPSTSIPASRSRALGSERASVNEQAGRFDRRTPELIVRAHAHTFGYYEQLGPGNGKLKSLSLPAWKLKDPFVHRTNHRNSTPEVGGAVISEDRGELIVQTWVEGVPPSPPVVIGG